MPLKFLAAAKGAGKGQRNQVEKISNHRKIKDNLNGSGLFSFINGSHFSLLPCSVRCVSSLKEGQQLLCVINNLPKENNSVFLLLNVGRPFVKLIQADYSKWTIKFLKKQSQPHIYVEICLTVAKNMSRFNNRFNETRTVRKKPMESRPTFMKVSAKLALPKYHESLKRFVEVQKSSKFQYSH